MKYKFQVSEVESVESDDEDHNKVSFTEEDSKIIEEDNEMEETKQVQNIKTGHKDLQPGDLIVTGPENQSATKNFLDNMIN